MSKKVFLKNFGCQMNMRDSEIISGLLLKKGYSLAKSEQDADIILFNTCSVRKHAEDKAISNMGALLKAQNAKRKTQPHDKERIYGIIGCTAQAMKGDLFKGLPELDLVCGTGQIHKLPELIEEAARTKVLACGNIDGEMPEIEPGYRENKKNAYVLISRGCDNSCSYCIVPYVRGKERSRRPPDIVNELKDLTARGIKEITLLGQNVNSYKSEDCDFVGLLKLVNGIDGIEKIDFMTSHPKDAGRELFQAIRDLDKVKNQLHLPAQAGSDRILQLMHRGYTAKKYKGLVKTLRRLVPDCKITTDVIVGFPSETEADFKKTYELMKEIKFNAAYIFKYSPRPFTQAAKLKDDVPKQEKERRHQILLEYQKKLARTSKTDEIAQNGL